MSKIKDSDLKQVIAALEADLNEAFEGSKASLVKAEGDDEKKGPPESSDDSASPPASDSASPAADAPPGDSAGGSAPPSPEMAGASAPAPQADPAAPQQGDQPLTPEALQAEYAQLPPEELDMHIQAALAAKEALAASAGAGAGGPPGAPPGAPPAGPAGGMPPPGASPAPDASSQMMPPAMKQEMSSHKQANGGMIKSEDIKAEFAAIKAAHAAEMAALQKSYKEDVENLTKAITLVVERPERKAVTSISYLKKTEPSVDAPAKTFSPAEVKAKLNELIPSLSKSERSLILDYYSGKVKIDALTSLVEKIK